MKKTLTILLLLFLLSISTHAQNSIKSEKGFTPQIGVLASMLNDLSSRIERTTGNMSQEDLDFLLDKDANRIGSLIMHLAATEAYYQVFTFENRGFNNEERAQWEDAQSLGEAAREKYQGNEVDYYIDIFKKVRQKTLEELKKKDDTWLDESPAGSSMNNHWAWFHVMEHQSSHLGQILLLRKRIK